VKKIQEKYVEKGYFLAEVKNELKPVGTEGNEVDLVFNINEHAKVMVKEIVFLGATKVPVEELKAVMATQEGGYLSFLTNQGTYREEMFQRDLQIIQMAYFDRGFINVRVDKPIVTLSPDKRNITITLRVEEGESYKVGKLDFSGDLLVGKDVLHKLMSSKEQTTFNRSLLARDIQAITDVYYDSGHAYANITPVTAVNAEQKIIDLTFDVQKGPKVYIERIDITGNTKTRDKVIRRQLRVYEGELFNGTGMRRSKEKVTALGFFETVEVTHKPGSDGEHVVVQIEIKEKSTSGSRTSRASSSPRRCSSRTSSGGASRCRRRRSSRACAASSSSATSTRTSSTRTSSSASTRTARSSTTSASCATPSAAPRASATTSSPTR
jgi:outer membrane protein insertion porin family